LALTLLLMAAGQEATAFHVIIKGGMVYDGSGGAPRRADDRATFEQTMNIRLASNTFLSTARRC